MEGNPLRVKPPEPCGELICAIAFIVYFAMRTPTGVTPMGDEGSATIAWISLAVAILTLVTTVVGLIQKLVELRAGNRG
jgi:hypothetical protein